MEVTPEKKLPKLLPLWHDQTSQLDLRRKFNHRFLDDRLPDYGGIGLDISNEEIKTGILKRTRDQVLFAAEVCALPFIPPNKGSYKHLSGWEQQNAEKDNIKRFCVKLEAARKCARTKKCSAYKKQVLLLQKKAKKMLSTGELQEINVSEQINELVAMFPGSFDISKDASRLGGCLAVSKAANQNHILLYPCGKKMNKLAFTEVTETNEVPLKSLKIVSSIKESFKVKSGAIRSVSCAYDGYCYAQQDKKCYFVKFENLSDISISLCSKGEIKYLQASPYIPDEYVAIFKGEKVKLKEVEAGRTLWSIDKSAFAREYYGEMYMNCDFGSQPRSALILSEKNLFSFDLRMKDCQKRVIFSTQHPSSFLDESFYSMKKMKPNVFQNLIASNRHLFICDERYPKKPVMIWNHLLKGCPYFCDITTYNVHSGFSDAVVILATDDQREISSFNVKTTDDQVHPMSLCAPLHLSSVADWSISLKSHCVNLDDSVSKRLCYPIIGVSAVPHTRMGFTAFQITALGDLFYQDFKGTVDAKRERTYKPDTGCVLSPPDKIWPHVKEWVEYAKKDRKPEVIPDLNLSRINVDLKSYLGSSISSKCSICKSFQFDIKAKSIENKNCPSCGIENSLSEKLVQASEKASFLIGPRDGSPDFSMFDLSEFTQFTDSYNKKILEPWLFTENTTLEVSESVHHSRTSPKSASYTRSDWEQSISNISIDPIPPLDAYLQSTPRVSQQSPLKRQKQELSQDLLNATSDNSEFQALQRNLSFHYQSSRQNFPESQKCFSSSLEENAMADLEACDQEYDDFVPSSQCPRSLIGETIRTPYKVELKKIPSSKPTPGF